MGIALVPSLLVGWGVWQREWSPNLFEDGAGGARILFLNAQDPPKEDAGTVLDAIQSCDPDLVVIVNPGWIGPVWRIRNSGLEEKAAPIDSVDRSEWLIRWVSPVLVASRCGDVSVRTLNWKDGIRVMRVRASEPVSDIVGLSDIVVVDLPSDPTVIRAEVLERLSILLNQKQQDGDLRADLLLGDFNTTPRTGGMDAVWPGLEDLFPRAGSGWGATWPRDRPLMRIDLALASEQVDARSLWTFDPGWGGHRGVVIEIGGDR